jgi:hypothetical protein
MQYKYLQQACVSFMYKLFNKFNKFPYFVS